MTKQVFDAVPKLTVKGEALHQLAQSAQGAREMNVLRLAANVADRETITVGSQSFQLVVLNTDTTFNASALDNTTGLDCIESWTAHGMVAGQVLRCENEFLLVKRVLSADQVLLSRGYAGSTVASHADSTNVYGQAATALTAGKVVLPLGATLTPAAAGPQIATGFTALNDQGFTAVYTANTLTIHREHNGSHAACSETLAGTDNVWAAANTYGGIEKGEVLFALGSRVPTATEVTLGVMGFYFPFTVTFARVTVFTTSTGATVAFGGAVAWSGGLVTLTNGTDPDFADTTTVVVEAYGN